MNAKKILNFLLFRSALSSRNLSSLALVALFFGVYVAAGGKIAPIPVKPDKPNSFSGTATGDKEDPRARLEDLSEVTGDVAPDAKPTGNVFGKRPITTRDSAKQKRDNKKTASQSEVASEANDDLADIEARLQRLRSKK